MPVPAMRTAAAWAETLADAERFSRDWGETAVQLGWSVEDLFGIYPNPRAARVDHMGLVPLLRGRPVIAMTAQTAVIGNIRGAPNTFYLYPWRQRGIPMWLVYGQIGGP